MSSFARGSHISIQLEHELTQRQALVLTRSEVLLKAGSLVVLVCLSFLVDFSCSRAIQSRFGSRRFLRDEHERAAPQDNLSGGRTIQQFRWLGRMQRGS